MPLEQKKENAHERIIQDTRSASRRYQARRGSLSRQGHHQSRSQRSRLPVDRWDGLASQQTIFSFRESMVSFPRPWRDDRRLEHSIRHLETGPRSNDEFTPRQRSFRQCAYEALLELASTSTASRPLAREDEKTESLVNILRSPGRVGDGGAAGENVLVASAVLRRGFRE